MKKIAMGIIIGNRGFFADELCMKARNSLIPVLTEYNIKPVILDKDEGVYGSVQSREDAKKCADLFKKYGEEIKGIIVSLPNFGDEKAIAETIRMSGLHVPVLVHAFPDKAQKLNYENRRDSFCGKISVCNNLKQYGIPFSLTGIHTIEPGSDRFKDDLIKFTGICRVVSMLKNLRIGLVGTRPADFNTVRYSEKILERKYITVEPVSLVDILDKIKEFDDNNQDVLQSLDEIKSYMNTERVSEASILKIAKLLLVLQNWIKEQEIDAIALQCWDSIQKNLGINPCVVMSILSNQGVPSACESDVMGALSMFALQAASNRPAGLVDWNNNYMDDPDKTVLFHCGNFAGELYSWTESSCPVVNYPEILASTLGKDNTYGAIDGRIKPGQVTFARIGTDDNSGGIHVYLAEGKITEDSIDTFGSWGIARVDKLQDLLRYICLNGFEHHVAINFSSVSDILQEAFSTYFKWRVYNHNM